MGLFVYNRSSTFKPSLRHGALKYFRIILTIILEMIFTHIYLIAALGHPLLPPVPVDVPLPLPQSRGRAIVSAHHKVLQQDRPVGLQLPGHAGVPAGELEQGRAVGAVVGVV